MKEKMNKIDEVVTRFIASTNEDFIEDLKRLDAHLQRNYKDIWNEEEFFAKRLKAIKHFNTICEMNGVLPSKVFEHTDRTRIGSSKMDRWLGAKSEEKSAILEEFRRTCVGANLKELSKMLAIRDIVESKYNKVAKNPANAFLLGEKLPSEMFDVPVDGECGYIDDAIKELEKARKTDMETLKDIYMTTGSTLVRKIQNDDTFKKKGDKKVAYDKFYTAYKSWLYEIAMMKDDFVSGYSLHFGSYNSWRDKLTTDLLNSKDETEQYDIIINYMAIINWKAEYHLMSEKDAAKVIKVVVDYLQGDDEDWKKLINKLQQIYI